MESKDPKATQPAASAQARIKKEEKISQVRGIRNAFLVIIACAICAVCIFLFLMGAPGNFEGGDSASGHPLNLAGTVYKGGFIVPILMTLLLTVIVLSIERAIALKSANGNGNTTKFVADIKADLAARNIDKAMDRCKKQKGSVASVVYNTLVKYKEMEQNNQLSKEQKLTTLRNEVEEATALEMPALSQNLPIIATPLYVPIQALVNFPKRPRLSDCIDCPLRAVNRNSVFSRQNTQSVNVIRMFMSDKYTVNITHFQSQFL